MKHFLLLFFLFLSLTSISQDYSAQWEGLFSFNEIRDIQVAGDRAFVASTNSIYTYDLNTNEVETITTIDGLDGQVIDQIYYSNSKDVLMIAYQDGLLQVVESGGNIRSIVAIRDKPTIAPDRKKVNEFLEEDDLLYIATDFGIALFNLDRVEFDDTYFIGDNGNQIAVNSVAIQGNQLFAATSTGGVRVADITNPFLIDYNNWTTINTLTYDEIYSYNNQVYAVTANRALQRYNGTSFTNLSLLSSEIIDVAIGDNNVLLMANDEGFVINNSGAIVDRIELINGEAYNFTSGEITNNQYIIGTEEEGLFFVNTNNITTGLQVRPDGPVRNGVFALETTPNQLWVSYGDYDIFYNPFPLDSSGVSVFAEEAWTNFTFDDVFEARNISSITANPENPEQIYFNSMHNGVVLYEDGVFTRQFLEANSSLESILPPNPAFVRVTDGSFDRFGNAWFLSTLVDNSLSRRNPDGSWRSYNVGQVYSGVTSSGTTKIATTRQGTILFGSTFAGLIGFDPENETFTRLTDDIGGGNLVNLYVSALAVDQNNAVWIGSTLGLRVLSSATSMFRDEISDARAIVVEDVNGIPRELLDGVSIVDIEVDGSNRKWVATAGSGAFFFSPSGEETIAHFTKDNSPLPSNNINDISIDDATGSVYFGTNNGLVSFQGERSSPPSNDLSGAFVFPNPVRPNYDGVVTIDGLTDNARIKITDVEGNLVYEEVSQGGTINWDTRSFAGNKVRSGVYLLMINTNDFQETKVLKLMIIR